MREKDLSKKVVTILRAKGYFVQRIESGSTGRGIPDVYWMKNGQDGWMELKVIKLPFSGVACEVPWRPGQNSWMYRANKAKPNSCYTILADTHKFYQIAMNRMYKPADMVKLICQSYNLAEVLL